MSRKEGKRVVNGIGFISVPRFPAERKVHSMQTLIASKEFDQRPPKPQPKWKQSKILKAAPHTLWQANSWAQVSFLAQRTSPWCNRTFSVTPCTIWRSDSSCWEPMLNAILRHEKCIHLLALHLIGFSELMRDLKVAEKSLKLISSLMI